MQLSRVRDIQSVAAQKLTAAGLTVSPMITEEDPNIFLSGRQKCGMPTAFSRREKADRLERFSIGSVSSSVAARAHCSVEVVRRKIV